MPTTTTIKESYSREEVISLLDSYGFHFSDNGDPDTDPHDWLNSREGVDDGYEPEDEDEDEDEESNPWD